MPVKVPAVPSVLALVRRLGTALAGSSVPGTREPKATAVGPCCSHTYGKALPNFVKDLLINYLSL